MDIDMLFVVKEDLFNVQQVIASKQASLEEMVDTDPQKTGELHAAILALQELEQYLTSRITDLEAQLSQPYLLFQTKIKEDFRRF